MDTTGGCLNEEQLCAFAAGSMSSAEIEYWAEHLETCSICQVLLAAQDSESPSMVAALRRTPAPKYLWDADTLDAALVSREAASPFTPRTSETLQPAARRLPRTAEQDVAPLLRRRLLALAALSLFGFIFMSFIQFGEAGDKVTVLAGGPFGAVLLTYGVVQAAVVLAYLWRRAALPVRRLRNIELALLAAAGIYSVYSRVAMLGTLQGVSFTSNAHQGLYVEHATLLTNLGWYLVIVGYGLFIPNTGKRCLMVVVGVALLALLSLVVASLQLEPVRAQLPGLLVVTTLGLSLTCAMAVFGSFRIDTLRREVVAARRLGQYRLVRKLGSGGMGEVHLAEHALLKRPCAVKLIRADRSRDPLLLERFEREVQAMARLTHPNTVEVYDYGRADDGTFYYVMEYLEGPTLTELVANLGAIPAVRAVHILRQLSGALREAHEMGLVHRDVKPGNVIVCNHGGRSDVAKLLDFGLVQTGNRSANSTDLTEEGFVMGTPDFMAPEQALGLATDARSDIYSFGALAYFLLAGRPPFQCQTVLDTLHAHARVPVVEISEVVQGISLPLAEVIMKCLAKEPTHRYVDTADLEAALERLPVDF